MRKRVEKNPKEKRNDEVFSARTMIKRMILPGILGAIIGAFFDWPWALIAAAGCALLSGIFYCERFDDEI